MGGEVGLISVEKVKDLYSPPGCINSEVKSEYIEISKVIYSRSHWEWHFRILFERSTLKILTSLWPRFSEKRGWSFELWALKELSKMSPHVRFAVPPSLSKYSLSRWCEYTRRWMNTLSGDLPPSQDSLFVACTSSYAHPSHSLLNDQVIEVIRFWMTKSYKG